ncbi:hypothetical protein EKH55_0747 [Sinorhizobium alkalisoli]|nr:hypothetical protein EKH55_0747 [Sinorhizobium alkalisoli]
MQAKVVVVDAHGHGSVMFWLIRKRHAGKRFVRHGCAPYPVSQGNEK